MKKSSWYKPAVKYVAPSHVFKKGDLLLVNFDTPKNSRFEIVKVNKAKGVLKVKVLIDYYKSPYKKGSIVNIGGSIFEQYWTFKHVSRRAK